MGGEIQVFLYEGRTNWYARFYEKSNRRYIVRSLRTSDQAQAIDRAISLWRDIQPKIDAGIPTETHSIERVINQYIEAEQRRCDAGIIKAGAVRDKRVQLKALLIFCKLNNLRHIRDIKPHSLNTFVAWRRDESRKLTEGKEGTLKHLSLNKSIREVRAWWKYVWKILKLADADLELMEVSNRHEQERTRNIAYTIGDWGLIEAELVRRSKEKRDTRRELLPIQIYGRWAFKTLLQVLVHSGMRPQEATQIIKWKDIRFIDSGDTQVDKALSNECVINIHNPKGKGSRKVVCDAGLFLKLFRHYCINWRRENGHSKLSSSSLVFANPLTDKPYNYSLFGNQFRNLLERLGLLNKGYTIRSSRGFYISRMLAAGHTPYLIAKNVGHSYDVMKQSYEQLTVEELIEEFC